MFFRWLGEFVFSSSARWNREITFIKRTETIRQLSRCGIVFVEIESRRSESFEELHGRVNRDVQTDRWWLSWSGSLAGRPWTRCMVRKRWAVVSACKKENSKTKPLCSTDGDPGVWLARRTRTERWDVAGIPNKRWNGRSSLVNSGQGRYWERTWKPAAQHHLVLPQFMLCLFLGCICPKFWARLPKYSAWVGCSWWVVRTTTYWTKGCT